MTLKSRRALFCASVVGALGALQAGIQRADAQDFALGLRITSLRMSNQAEGTVEVGFSAPACVNAREPRVALVSKATSANFATTVSMLLMVLTNNYVIDLQIHPTTCQIQYFWVTR
jgi:hypothetical protein